MSRGPRTLGPCGLLCVDVEVTDPGDDGALLATENRDGERV